MADRDDLLRAGHPVPARITADAADRAALALGWNRTRVVDAWTSAGDPAPPPRGERAVVAACLVELGFDGLVAWHAARHVRER